jgi:chromosome segregation ATPase
MKFLMKALLMGAPLALLLVVTRAYHNENMRQGSLLEATSGYREESARLAGRVRLLEGRLTDLQSALVAQSNSAVQARAELLEEKGTHDPLRAQIEKMSALQITFQAQLRQKDDQLAQVQADLQSARQQAQAEQQKSGQAGQKVQQLEATVSTLTAARDELKRKVDAAAEQTAKLESDLVAERASLKDLNEKLAAATRQSGSLSQQQAAAKAEFDKALQQLQADLAAARARIAELEAKLQQAAPPPAAP